jgi:signal transduction histidine kinase
MSEKSSENVDYVSAMMHELKTSLTAIIASAEILADELNLDEGGVHWKLVQSIIRNAHRLNERVTDFAQMPRPRMQDFQFQPEALDFGQIIRDMATRIHPTVQERAQSLTLDIPGSLPFVRGDREHLEQVLLTLTSNASKFSPEGGSITVSASRHEPGQVLTRVSDTCGGIAESEQERVFEPHYQIQRGDGKGGLGLTIARFLVELHGGKIWLESQSGAGCTFLFTLTVFRRVQ